METPTPVEPSDINDEHVLKAIHELVETCGGTRDSFEAELVTQMIQASLRMLTEGHDLGQLKLITRALKELRYAYYVFNQYPHTRRVSIFGSARTPEDHPDYLAAKAFSEMMVEYGWLSITGGANGIMKAGLEGHQKDQGFGLSIKLPFEAPANNLIEGAHKLIIFRYFFTRKLMFMSHSHAVAAFPGGFGTMDELFEVLTLLQTGKANIIPVVLLEGQEGHYWDRWEENVHKQFLANGWISPEDLYFYYKAPSIQAAVEHINQFYKRYHSSRYIKDTLIIRLKEPLTSEHVEHLNQKYRSLVQSGVMALCDPFPEEKEHLELPRLAFIHTRNQFGLVRALINDINTY